MAGGVAATHDDDEVGHHRDKNVAQVIEQISISQCVEHGSPPDTGSLLGTVQGALVGAIGQDVSHWAVALRSSTGLGDVWQEAVLGILEEILMSESKGN